MKRGVLPKIMTVAEGDSASLYVTKQLGGVLVILASDGVLRMLFEYSKLQTVFLTHSRPVLALLDRR